MAIAKPKPRFLAIDELMPVVEAASCVQLDKNEWYRYRVPSLHFLLIESGHVEAITPDGACHGRAGDLLCFRPTEWNEYKAFVPMLYYQASIRFAAPPQHRWTPSLAECGPLPLHLSLGKAFGEMRRVFETLCIEVSQPGAVHLLRVRAAVHEMLAIIAGTKMRDRSGGQHLDEWERMRMRLDMELHTELSVETMARRMNLSASYFKRIFKQRFGVSPKAYHAHARLQEAARLLRGTDKPVKSIAYELGFSNPKVFTRLFKNQIGVLPTDLRQDTGRAKEIPASTRGQLFPLNIPQVPPAYTAEQWMRRCLVRGHRSQDGAERERKQR